MGVPRSVEVDGVEVLRRTEGSCEPQQEGPQLLFPQFSLTDAVRADRAEDCPSLWRLP